MRRSPPTPCVVDENVEPAELGSDGVDDPVEGAGLADVGDETDGSVGTMGSVDLVDDFVHRGCVHVDDGHSRPFVGEQLRGGPTHPAGRASHERPPTSDRTRQLGEPHRPDGRPSVSASASASEITTPNTAAGQWIVAANRGVPLVELSRTSRAAKHVGQFIVRRLTEQDP